MLPISFTALLVNTGRKLVLIDTGTAGQVLLSNGPNSLPIWTSTAGICSNCLVQTPATTVQNTIAPTANSSKPGF